MKKINLFFLSLFLVIGFFGVASLVQAQDVCCVPANNSDPCESINSQGRCDDGTKQFLSCAEAERSGLCSSSGSSGSTTLNSVEFKNPLNVDSVSGLLTSLLESLRGLIVVVAIVFMVIGGIMYMVSGGNEAMVKRAKQTWTGAVVGLAIALAAPAFLNEILSILQAGPDVGSTGSDITIKQIAVNVLNFLMSVLGILAIISLIIGGGMYLTAYGDEKRLESGKKIVTYAIIGVVIALSALAVTRQIASLINVTP